MKRYFISMALGVILTASASAQTLAEKTAAAPQVQATEQTEAQETQFTRAAWGDLKFELPVGMTETRDKTYLAKMPDGSFGISISRDSNKAVNQKRASSLVTTLARSMHVTDAKVSNITVGGMKGALATGHIEDKEVAMMILTSGGNLHQIISIFNPERQPLYKHFLNSICK